MLEITELFFVLIGIVALLIIAAVALVVCDCVIRRDVREAQQMEALREMRAEQLMQARKERWASRKEQTKDMDRLAALICAARNPHFVSMVGRDKLRTAFGLPVENDVETPERLRPLTSLDEWTGKYMDTGLLYRQAMAAAVKPALCKRVNLPDMSEREAYKVDRDALFKALEDEVAKVEIVSEEVNSYAGM